MRPFRAISLQQLFGFLTSAIFSLALIFSLDRAHKLAVVPKQLSREVEELDADINRFVRHRRLQHVVESKEESAIHRSPRLDLDGESLMDKHSQQLEGLFLNGSSMVIGHIGRRVHTLGKKLEQYNFTNAGQV